MPYRVKPTAKQAKALELIRSGSKQIPAMKKAGYSKATASHPGQNLLTTPGAKSNIEQYRAEFAAVGITQRYMESTQKSGTSHQGRRDHAIVRSPDVASKPAGKEACGGAACHSPDFLVLSLYLETMVENHPGKAGRFSSGQ